MKYKNIFGACLYLALIVGCKSTPEGKQVSFQRVRPPRIAEFPVHSVRNGNQDGHPTDDNWKGQIIRADNDRAQ